MKRQRILLFAAFGAAMGCGAPSQEVGSSAPAPVETIAKPNAEARTSLVLVHAGNRMSLSDSEEDVFQVFGNPKPSFAFRDLPPGFQAPYAAKGWETSREGVGVISYGDRVVAIMRQLTRATADDLQQIVDTLSKENLPIKPKIVQGAHVTYYFWEKSPQRLMVSALQTSHDGLHVTEALGDDVVMDALNISPLQAKDQAPKVDAVLAKSPKVK